MCLYKKEKRGNNRIIIILGIKFEYRKGRNYKFEKVIQTGVTGQKRSPQVVVSLTSFPDRIPYLHKTVTSLLNQTFKPDRLILWLAKEQFPDGENNLTKELIDLKNYGLEIKLYHDIKPYKKLIPALKEFPQDIIITFDDDIYYDKKTVELLYESYLKNPEFIHCHRCTKIYYKKGEIKAKGGGKKYYKKPSFANKLVGVGGVLYPPNSLYKDITDENLFIKLAPTNDDIWFWLMAVMNNTKIKVIKNNIYNPAEIDETMEGPCLSHINDHGNKLFYKQRKNVLNYYQGLEDKIKSDM